MGDPNPHFQDGQSRIRTIPPWAVEEEPPRVASGADPAQTIHLALGRMVSGRDRIGDELMIDALARRDDPDSRAIVAENMNAGWFVLGFGCALGLAVFSILTDQLFGPATRNVVIAVWAALAFFCIAGNANILWRRYRYVPRARRLAQRHGVTNEHYVNAMRRALPPNSTLVAQAVVAILAFAIVMASI